MQKMKFETYEETAQLFKNLKNSEFPGNGSFDSLIRFAINHGHGECNAVFKKYGLIEDEKGSEDFYLFDRKINFFFMGSDHKEQIEREILKTIFLDYCDHERQENGYFDHPFYA